MISGKILIGGFAKGFIERIRDALGFRQKIKIGSTWRFEHWRNGVKLAERVQENLVPDEFINHVLDVALSGGSQVSTWYLAPFSDDYTPVASDTYAAPGFTENTGYDETVRPQWQEAGVSAKSITNSANKATFTMDGTGTAIYGAALVSVDTKGDTAGGGILGPVARLTDGALAGIVDDDIIKIFVTVFGSDA